MGGMDSVGAGGRRSQRLDPSVDFVPGSNWVQGMRDAISRTERTIAVMSPDYLASAYGTAEWEAAWAADQLGAKRKLLIGRARKCERPDLLGQVVSTDLFGISEDEARKRLLAMVSAARTARAKPVEARRISWHSASYAARAAFSRCFATGVEGARPESAVHGSRR